eukprot:CAMPEP_0114343736 /NCGR_PEP_ID=MMETSP0101-20121206/10848_1 /TAXON_ID=38822 ORGANISM="Pteridomonas danica, Strain PT" /NCGR_SAMPLE_ID=MMETSP0101 /ASSEMBLY_ACC=CAM_ASM_000211 /LENGTH=351 /DNA_ID=CAMNT_0001478643 /DNA_START=686 /DNA_END=1741 /DNA_ORIENTATION=+
MDDQTKPHPAETTVPSLSSSSSSSSSSPSSSASSLSSSSSSLTSSVSFSKTPSHLHHSLSPNTETRKAETSKGNQPQSKKKHSSSASSSSSQTTTPLPPPVSISSNRGPTEKRGLEIQEVSRVQVIDQLVTAQKIMLSSQPGTFIWIESKQKVDYFRQLLHTISFNQNKTLSRNNSDDDDDNDDDDKEEDDEAEDDEDEKEKVNQLFHQYKLSIKQSNNSLDSKLNKFTPQSTTPFPTTTTTHTMTVPTTTIFVNQEPPLPPSPPPSQVFEETQIESDDIISILLQTNMNKFIEQSSHLLLQSQLFRFDEEEEDDEDEEDEDEIKIKEQIAFFISRTFLESSFSFYLEYSK